MSDTGVVVTAEDYLKTRGRVVLDYTSRDFAAIRAQLVGLAKGFMPEWETAGEVGDFGTLLLELFAYMGDITHFYIDRTASEGFLGTAVRRQSVLYIADMLGYKPIGQQAASVELSFSIDPRAAEIANPNLPDPVYTVTLPAGTRITNSSNSMAEQIVFELDSPVTLSVILNSPATYADISNDNPVSITASTDVLGYATEGITRQAVDIGISKGTPNSTYLIPDRGIINGTITIITREGGNVVNWTYVSDLSLARPTQSAFTSYMDDEDRTFIVFGDNASGRIPPYGAEIFVSYRNGVGAAANDLAGGSLTVILPPTNVETWGITVNNADPPVGGSNPEDVESMRFSVPRATGRLKSRAVTLNDYADLALQVPGVGKAIAYGTLYTAVYVRIAPTNGVGDDYYMTRLTTAVEDHLRDKVLVGTQVFAEPSSLNDIWLNTFVRVTVHVQDAYNRAQVRDAVEDSVRSVFTFNNMDFGKRVTIGQIYRSALSIAGVEWVDLKWLSSTAVVPGAETSIETNSLDRIIGDVIPDDLHIVRLYPTNVTELELSFPTLSEDERTHDGLWVKAVGGLVNT